MSAYTVLSRLPEASSWTRWCPGCPGCPGCEAMFPACLSPETRAGWHQWFFLHSWLSIVVCSCPVAYPCHAVIDVCSTDLIVLLVQQPVCFQVYPLLAPFFTWRLRCLLKGLVECGSQESEGLQIRHRFIEFSNGGSCSDLLEICVTIGSRWSAQAFRRVVPTLPGLGSLLVIPLKEPSHFHGS